jgi:hypothetical protein
MTLPKETIERIRDEARAYTVSESHNIRREDCSFCMPDYVAGATAEAERAKVLIEALEKISRHKNGSSLIASTALSSYKKTEQNGKSKDNC